MVHCQTIPFALFNVIHTGGSKRDCVDDDRDDSLSNLHAVDEEWEMNSILRLDAYVPKSPRESASAISFSVTRLKWCVTDANLLQIWLQCYRRVSKDANIINQFIRESTYSCCGGAHYIS